MNKLFSILVCSLWLSAAVIGAQAAPVIASPVFQPFEPPAGWPLHLSDGFDSDENGWPLGVKDNDWARNEWQISEGKYHWQAKAHDDFVWYVYPETSQPTDFYLSVDIRQVSGPDDAVYGIAFRISNTGYYVFGISNAGTYALLCWHQDNWYTLIDWTNSPDILSGQSNQIAILAKGNNLRLAINERLVADLEDDRLSSGRAGLLIELFEAGDEAAFEFDNYTLYASVDASSLFQEARSFSRQGDYAAAIDKYNQALAMYREMGDLAGEARCLNNAGHNYAFIGDYTKALEYLEQAVAVYQSSGNQAATAYPLDGMGMVYRDMGDYSRSLAHYQQALGIWQISGDEEGEAGTLRGMGQTCAAMGDNPQAIGYAAQAVELWRKLGIQDEQAWTLHDIGFYYANLDDYEQAINYYLQAFPVYEQLGDEAGQASILVSIGWSYLSRSRQSYNRQHLQQARDYLERGLSIYQQSGNPSGQAEALHDLALVCEDMGDYASAVDYMQQALELWREIGDREQEAWALNSLGWTRSKLFDYQSALEPLEESLEIFRQFGDRSSEAWVLGNIANITADNIGYRKGMEYLQQKLEIYQEIGDQGGEADTLNELGIFCIVLGEYEQGLQYFQAASELWHQHGDRLNESRAINNIGVVYSYLGDMERALAQFEQSLQISIEIDDPWREAIWRSNIGEYYLGYGKYEDALQYFNQAKEIFERVQDPRRAYDANTLNSIGLVYKAMGDYQKALPIMQEALSIEQAVREPHGQANVLHGLGELYYATREYQKALEVLNQALQLWQQTGDPAGKADTLGLIGQVKEAMGNPGEALQNYLEAVAVRESVLGQVKAEAFQASLAAQGSGVYQRAVRLLVQNAEYEQAFELSERSRARAFLDTLGNKRPELRQSVDAGLLRQEEALRDEITALESGLITEKSKPEEQRSDQVLRSIEGQLAAKQKSYEELLAKIQMTSPELASLVSVPTTTVADVQATLDQDTTLLAYYLTDSNALAFILSATDFQVVELPAGPDKIGGAVEGFRMLGLSNLEDFHPRSLHDLYAWLVAPLKSSLETPVVGIIPHQRLHYVPFAALYDGESYFGEQFTLFQLPSASTLPFIQAKSEREVDTPLVMGDPQTGNPALPALDYAAQEASQVAGLFHQPALLGERASEQALRAQSGTAGALHLAAHGALNPVAPLFSRLWLAPEGEQDGRLNVYEVYGLDLGRAGLVVLSACQTQLGELSAGDEVTSLNRAFLYGAPTVISSLWSVDDAATGALMARFYAHLKDGEGKAEALNLAQSELRGDTQHPEWAHPYYWAGFVLNGDPGKTGASTEGGGESFSPKKILGTSIIGLAALLATGALIIGIRRRRRKGST